MILGLLILIAFAACVTFVFASIFSITKPRRTDLQRYEHTDDPRPVEN